MALTRARKIGLGIVIALAMLVGTAAVLPALLWGDGVDYSRVASIKATREYQDRALLARAWALPVASLYRSGMDFQSNGSFCGPASVVNVMRSLRLGADQKTVLEGTEVSTFMGVVPGGITLDQLAGVAQSKPGRKATVLRDLDLGGFRAHLRHFNDPARRYVVNFARGPLFAGGSGHHSPIGGYLEEQDLVFVLDVNKKFGPWLVKADRLHEAMNTIDRATGKKRGLLLIE